jgi:hypothetical protein
MKPASIKQVLLAMTWVCLAAAWPAFGHHSASQYDHTKSVTLKGSVKAFQWTNPHVVIWVLVQPDGGGEPQEWGVETTSPGVLTRSGWTHSSIKAGEPVSVEFSPLRDGSQGGFLRSVTLLNTGQKLVANFAASETPGLK